MNRHRIRLRKPWQEDATERGLRWRRRFGQPSGLTASDTVWLVTEDASLALSVVLNNDVLGAVALRPASIRFDVTGRLRVRNELVLLAEGGGQAVPPGASEPPAAVYLEIVSGGEN